MNEDDFATLECEAEDAAPGGIEADFRGVLRWNFRGREMPESPVEAREAAGGAGVDVVGGGELTEAGVGASRCSGGLEVPPGSKSMSETAMVRMRLQPIWWIAWKSVRRGEMPGLTEDEVKAAARVAEQAVRCNASRTGRGDLRGEFSRARWLSTA